MKIVVVAGGVSQARTGHNRGPCEPNLVEITGIEPVASGLQSRRSPN